MKHYALDGIKYLGCTCFNSILGITLALILKGSSQNFETKFYSFGRALPLLNMSQFGPFGPI